jgi:methylase of polypeptide subunit release factors
VTYPALLPADGLARLRDALTGAGYTSTGIADRLGPAATDALKRNDFRAAIEATGSGDALDTLIRLYEIGLTEPKEHVARALNLDDALTAGLVEPHENGYRAGVDLEPYGDEWWIVADLASGRRPGPLPPDHVLGLGGASHTLANSVIRDRVGRALDLGTGCGVQALHLSTHAGEVVATDLLDRALRFAATTAALSGVEFDLRRGDMVAPVAGERFDLVVSNPPFVAGPGTATHTYRDSGRPGDAVCAELAAAAPGLLKPGGTIQFLANWLHVKGEDWAERVAGWFAGSGLDLWVIQRELSDPMSYVDLWLTDAAEEHDPYRAAAWLDWFDAHRVEAVGFGLVTARAGGRDEPIVRLEDFRQPVAKPFGPEVSKWFHRQDWLRGADLLDTRYRLAPGVKLTQEADMSPEGWEVSRQFLVQSEGLRYTEEVEPVLLAVASGCDGTVRLRDQLAILAAAWDETPATLEVMGAALVPHLVERGFIEPVNP